MYKKDKSKGLLLYNTIEFLEIMKNILILNLIAIILIPVSYANALPGDAELVLEDIQITPLEPKTGETITITAEVYNAGKINTESVASIITIAFFVDEKLVDIKDIGDVKIGIKNNIKIVSESIWKAEIGEHTIKVVLDYHDTLKNELDSSDNNKIEKVIRVEENTSVTTEEESAFIKFNVISNKDTSINKGIVKIWNHSIVIENGFTDWVDITPIIDKLNVAEIILPDQSSVKAEPFLVFPGERKVIILKINEFNELEIPDWIKNNAGWWAEGTIDDETFIQGIQFMIKEGIIKI